MRVGLTGGVASGKSTVSAMLAELGAVVIDADLLAREVVAAGSDGLAEIVAEFGPQVLTEDGVTQGRHAAERLLAQGSPPTALVCCSDSLALGAHAIDPAVAVTGFDDTPVASAVGLSSVAQPLVEAAAACVEQVLDVIHGRAATAQQVMLPPTFTVRQSTPAPALTADR